MFDKINNILLPQFRSLVNQWIPGGYFNGAYYVVRNPTRDDKNAGSFKINTQRGNWRDHATNEWGKDPVSLFAYINNISQGEALKRLSESNISVVQTQPETRKTIEWIPICPAPEGTPPPPLSHYSRGNYTQRWEIKNADGLIYFCVCRFDTPEGKQVIPLTYCRTIDGHKVWRWKMPKPPLPLYGLPELAKFPESSVLIVEGEKCKDAAQKILGDNVVVVTWTGGSSKWQMSDWSVLEGRKVVIWPDFDSKRDNLGKFLDAKDQPGYKAALGIAERIAKITKAIKIITPLPGYVDGWDVFDAIADGYDRASIVTFIRENSEKYKSETTLKEGCTKFWEEHPKAGEYKAVPGMMMNWLSTRGYWKSYLSGGNKQAAILKIDHNVVEEVSDQIIQDEVLEHLRLLSNSNGKSKQFQELYNNVVNSAEKYFGKYKIRAMNNIILNLKSDEPDCATLFFRDKFIEITKDTITPQPYHKLKRNIWKSQKNERDYICVDGEGEFEIFVNNVCSCNEEKKLGLMSAIGYLVHNYKNPALAKLIIFTDEKLTDSPEGRTGKSSILTRGIGYIAKLREINGKGIDFKSQFVFQGCQVDDKIICIDDAQRNFDIENMFHFITGSWEFEDKRVSKYSIPFSEAPKFLLTTNYMIRRSGGSAEARIAEYGFSDHYNPDNTPAKEFGHLLFDEWDESEWGKFYNFMVRCIQVYLRNGLVEYDSDELRRRKLLHYTCQEFVEFMDRLLKNYAGEYSGILMREERPIKTVFEDFCKNAPDWDKRASRGRFARKTFSNWMKQYAKLNSLPIHFGYNENADVEYRDVVWFSDDNPERKDRQESLEF